MFSSVYRDIWTKLLTVLNRVFRWHFGKNQQRAASNMTANAIKTPYTFFTDTNGKPLEAGYVYIGNEGFDAENNQKSVYTDSSLSVTLSQPIRTSGGLPVVNGGAVPIYCDGGYSIKVLNKNRELVYSSLTDFKTVEAGAVSATDGTPTTPFNNVEQFINNLINKEKSNYIFNSSGSRSLIQYYSLDTVLVHDTVFPMTGFRFAGQYKKSSGPIFDWATPKTVSYVNDLGVQSSATTHTWYAVFAVANDGDANCVMKVMPYIRLNNVTGATGDFGLCGEDSKVRTAGAKTMNISTNALKDTDCLVISETMSGRPNGFSGRVTTVASNTTSSITIDEAGTIGDFDWLLCAPPGYDHYRYVGTFYRDSAEVRNLSDSGSEVDTYGIYLDNSNVPGLDGVLTTVTPGLEVDVAGIVPPLATAVAITHTEAYSTSATGSIVINVGLDSAHFPIVIQDRKETTSSIGRSWSLPTLSLAFQQRIYLQAGSGAALNIAATTRKVNIRGWNEP